MALDIVVNISQAAITGTVGFGNPLLLVSKAATAVEYTECDKLSKVATLLGENSDAYKAADLLWAQDNPPEKIAVCAVTSKADAGIDALLDREWRQLLVFTAAEGDSTKAEIAAKVEGRTDKMYYTTVSSTSELTALAGKENTVCFYYPTEGFANYAVAAVVGASAGLKAGGFTYKNLIIAGLEPLNLSDDDLTALHAITSGNNSKASAFTVVKKAGDIVTSEGTTASGEYVDVVDSKHWIIQNIEYDTQKKLNVEAKVPYTDVGISSLSTITANVLKRAFDNGMIATDEDGLTPLYSVNFKNRAAMSAEDRKNRIYTGGNFTFTLAGAIHNAVINGELVI